MIFSFNLDAMKDSTQSIFSVIYRMYTNRKRISVLRPIGLVV